MISAMIVDDEPLARETLRGMCARSGRVTVVAEAPDGQEALDLLAAARPLLMFVDIGMPRMNGIALADRIRTLRDPPQVVFATAYDHHAAAAFDLDVTDYLLKPLDPDRFARALARIEARHAASGLEPAQADRDLWLPDRGGMARVAMDAISHVTAESDYVRVHAAGRSFLLRETLGAMEERLGRDFVRVHRSTLIRKSGITGLRHLGGGSWVAIDAEGVAHRIGRKYMDALGNLTGGERGAHRRG